MVHLKRMVNEKKHVVKGKVSVVKVNKIPKSLVPMRSERFFHCWLLEGLVSLSNFIFHHVFNSFLSRYIDEVYFSMHIQNKQRETRHGFYTKSLPSSLSYLQVLKTETMRFRVGTNVVYCVPALFPLLFAVLSVLESISSIGGPFFCASGRSKREIGRDDTSLPPLCC